MNVVMIVAALVAVALVVFMLIKKADIKLTLLATGLALLFTAVGMGITVAEKTPPLLQPFQVTIDQFKSVMSGAGFVIMLLGGYVAYMGHIGANAATVELLTRPLKHLKSPWVLVPFVFLLGNLLSLVITSAANLAIILLATLYPVLRAARMSTLTAAGVIATTSTVIPTPLSSDNIAIAKELATHPEFASLTVPDYVFGYLAPVAIPTLLLMAVAHYFWQKCQDKRDLARGYVSPDADVDPTAAVTLEGGPVLRTVFALLPLLPILVLLGVYAWSSATGIGFQLNVELAVLICWLVAILVSFGFKRDRELVMSGTTSFFKGMGSAFDIVALLVAASVFVAGLKGIGLITSLQNSMESTNVAGWVFPLILVGITATIVVLSGSGIALFFAMVPLIYGLAQAAGISPFAVSIPMGMTGNLMRACSPVAAVVVIVAGTTKETPMRIVRRTWFPMVVGVVFAYVLSMIRFL